MGSEVSYSFVVHLIRIHPFLTSLSCVLVKHILRIDRCVVSKARNITDNSLDRVNGYSRRIPFWNQLLFFLFSSFHLYAWGVNAVMTLIFITDNRTIGCVYYKERIFFVSVLKHISHIGASILPSFDLSASDCSWRSLSSKFDWKF